MSLQSDYYKELEGRETIETEDGFITYQIFGKECYIMEVYVVPAKRRSGICFYLADRVVEVAKSKECTFISSTVILAFNGSTEALKTHLAYGLKPVKAADNKIWLAKEI